MIHYLPQALSEKWKKSPNNFSGAITSSSHTFSVRLSRLRRGIYLWQCEFLSLVKPCNWTIIKFLNGLATFEDGKLNLQNSSKQRNASTDKRVSFITRLVFQISKVVSLVTLLNPTATLISSVNAWTYPTHSKAAVVTKMMHLNSFFISRDLETSLLLIVSLLRSSASLKV